MPITVSEIAASWLAVYVATARNARFAKLTAQRVRDYLVPELGALPIGEVRPSHVRCYRLALEQQQLSALSVRHVLADARCMFRWAVEERMLRRSPFPLRVMPRIQERPPDRLTDVEVRMLMRAPEPYRWVLRLGISTGLRWAELTRLQASDMQGDMLLVHHTKTGRLRRVPLVAAIASEIACKSGRLVPYSTLSPGTFSRTVRRLTGVRGFHVHQLRHTFACRWIENGGSLPALQQILGHQHVTTTQRYARLSDEHVRREAQSVGGKMLEH